MTKNRMPKMAKSQLAIAIACVFASAPVLAQQEEQQQTEQQAEQQQEVERIQVTGSRIRTDGMDEATPVQVIQAEDAITQGFTNLGDLLQSSTIAAGSGQVTSAISSAFVADGGSGVNTLSLRGLGANRTLVLLNGRRAGPAGTQGAVSAFDLNVMPLAAIERIEILKDGASSLYGSDAVAGVVNIITKKGDASSVDINMSQPMDDGGETMRLSATLGRTYDKGSFRVVADYNLQKELANGDRDFFQCGQRYAFDPETGERTDNVDPRTGDYHCSDLPWGHVWIYDYSTGGLVTTRAQYDYDGDLGNYIPRFNQDPNSPDYMATEPGWPEGWYQVGYDNASDAVDNQDHPFQDRESLIPRQEKITLYGQGDYLLTDDVTLYAEALLNRRTTEINGYRQFWSYKYNENFYAGDPLSEGWTGAQWLSPTPITDHADDEIVVDYRRFVVGANGYLGEWFWDFSIQDSHSDGDYTSDVIYDDAISPYNFASGSCEGTVTPVRGVDCVDVPWLDPDFLAGEIPQNVRDFMFGRETGNTVYKQRTAEGYFSGDLMELPAGVVGAAIGAQYQTDEIVDTPAEVTRIGNAWGSSSAGITQGKSNSRAVFGEIQVPVLADLPFAERLDFTGSARWTDVSTYGSDTTYKMGLNWLIGEGFRIRATRGSSFRSPALYELFLNSRTSFPSQRSIDPCVDWANQLEQGNISPTLAANCEADGLPGDHVAGAISATFFESGGAENGIKAETSVSEVIGFVWIPESVDFAFSADYFNIEIDDEVTSLSPANIVYGCYNSENFASEPLCDQFTRDDTDNRIDEIFGGYLNISEQINRGIDFNVNYRTATPIGDLSFRYEHTVQIEASRKLLPTSDPVDYTGEIGNPKHVGVLTTELRYSDWTFNWTARYIGDGDNYERFGNGEFDNTASYRGEESIVKLDVPSVFYHAFSANYDFDNGFSTTVGVANAFDREPPLITGISGITTRRGNSAFYSQYDWLGRRVFLNLSYDF